MKLAYKNSECGGAITLLAFLLFVAAIILDFCSTALMLSTETKFVELNPIVRADYNNPLPELLRADLIVGCLALIAAMLLVYLRDLFRASRVLKEVSIIATKVILISAFAKLWFFTENILLYLFNSNFSYELQLFFENFEILNINSREDAYLLSVVIAAFAGLSLYLATMRIINKGNKALS